MRWDGSAWGYPSGEFPYTGRDPDWVGPRLDLPDADAAPDATMEEGVKG